MGQFLSSERILREFYTLTNNGIVFDLDLSRRSDLGVLRDGEQVVMVLTNDEVNERKRWADNKARISDGIEDNRLLRNWRYHWSDKAEDLLRLQIAAPILDPNPNQVSHRSAIAEQQRAGRMYPPQLHKWEEFRTHVANFNADNTRLLQGNQRRKANMAVKKSFTDNVLLTDELGEQHYLKSTAMLCLQEAGLANA